MNLSHFARIGNREIIQAIGIQKPYVKIEEKIIEDQDFSPEECQNCNGTYTTFSREENLFFTQNGAKQEDPCKKCPHAKFTERTEWVKMYYNEKNYYGDRKKVGRLSICSFLLIHFSMPDAKGIVKDVSISDMADILNATSKGVAYALKQLEERGYISISASVLNPSLKDIRIIGYDEIGNKADKGGRGYVTLNRTFLQEILKEKNVNAIRIFLRALVSAETDQESTAFLTGSELRRFLPSYCKPGVIAKCISEAKGQAFNIEKNKGGLKLQIKDFFVGRKNFEKKMDAATDAVTIAAKEIKVLVAKAQRAFSKRKRLDRKSKLLLSEYGIRPIYEEEELCMYRAPRITRKDINDLSVLASFFGLKSMENGFRKSVQIYINNKEKGSIGAMVRSWIRKTEYLAAEA